MIIFSSTALYELNQAYRESELYYERLQALVQVNEKDIPATAIDFAALREESNNLVAWLYSPNAKINYPVVLADNYDWYFRHLPDNSEGIYGTPFIDIDGDANFSKKVNIIYGKRLADEKMFGSLPNYQEQDYFENNPYLYMYTEESNYRIELIYGCNISTGEWRGRAFMYEANFIALLGYGKSNTTFKSHVQYQDNDQFIVLNALEKGYDKQSYFVIGVLREINKS